MLWLHETNFSRLTDVSFTKGGFPLLDNFYVRRRVKFTFVNKIEAMYGRDLQKSAKSPNCEWSCPYTGGEKTG